VPRKALSVEVAVGVLVVVRLLGQNSGAGIAPEDNVDLDERLASCIVIHCVWR